jgi:hypothetical protein
MILRLCPTHPSYLRQAEGPDETVAGKSRGDIRIESINRAFFPFRLEFLVLVCPANHIVGMRQ